MSCIETVESRPPAGLIVHVAENGHSFELNCTEEDSVDAVQRCLETLCQIQFNDQLLLCGDMKLESHRPLSFYKLLGNGRDVFLYNRARLIPDCPLPSPEEINFLEPTELPSPSSLQDPHPLDDAVDPALKALSSYERQFRYHFQRGHAIYVSTQSKFEACKRLLRQQKVQERAFETARGNMDHYYRMINQTYVEFMKHFSRQHRHHSDLLLNFDKDIEKLRSIKLHPALQTGSLRCLLDFICEDNLRKLASNCAVSHRQFQVKVSHLKGMYNDLAQGVDRLFSMKAPVGIRDVELMIKEYQQYLDEQTSIMQSLSKDVNTVKKLVDDCVSSQVSASDAVSALGRMYNVHEKNHLPRMHACHRENKKLLDFCKIKKDEMNLFVHRNMQTVAHLQSCTRDIRMQLPAFKEAMTRQDGSFADLRLLRRIGPAYRVCLAEVVRRKASMKLYMGQAGQMAEKLARKREDEVRRREEFLKVQSVCIPRDILASMGLFDSPSQCDVNITPFDTNLLDIDITDIDRYAPESLVGLSVKVDKPISSTKGSFSGSYGSCNSLEVEESPSTIDGKDAHEELFDESESIEIAGTSKLEVENARLKAELASALALVCSYGTDIDYDTFDDSKLDSILKENAERTAEALRLKDEYCKHFQDMLKVKQMQCITYEKRIQELEQRLSDQYMQQQKISSGGKEVSVSALSALKTEDCKSEVCGDAEVHAPYVPPEPMDEVSSSPAALDPKEEHSTVEMSGKDQEGLDESMTDLLGIHLQPVEPVPNSLDASMLEPQRDEQHIDCGSGKEKEKRVIETVQDPLNTIPCRTNTALESGLLLKNKEDLVVVLESALSDKSNECDETQSKLEAAMEEIVSLRRELEASIKLLDESQLNCAHLENCLHEAREEAHTNLCAADRKASEYRALRASAIKIRGLFERLRTCVSAPGGVAGFTESLRSLALSLGSSSANDNEDESAAEIRACIRILADKVSILSRQRAELLERCSRFDAAQGLLSKELEGKNELVKTLYNKKKQVNKERVAFLNFEVHELAAFVLNSAGHYEAINRNRPNYYLSDESVALFIEHLPYRPTFIIGQIVHIEHKFAKPPTPELGDQSDLLSSKGEGSGLPESFFNPYGLPLGSEYYVVTVAMLPEPIQSSPP
ncbi:hypothetical protein AMTRI_Chr05g61180 [Amborella trichopoda]|uniref:Uncharacterized protein n=1 Tax=Amborella trichopoda TaxID=13333 RepID=U5DEE8_AMBTC|nr:autophagy-related protein 11 [Amborella trichopoda]XP_020531629.1 autophagy-related protein 11 [Amborella trichopoda]ERN19812.1 hypothetical protein AMTR_s00064p00167250 [Amborella trichopoda]|eukprot:XP_006858345.1 autophagy-related protein 11 [Amborella trichopoda]